MMNRRVFFGMAAGAAAAAGGIGCARAKKTMNRIRGKSSSLESGKVKVAALPNDGDARSLPRRTDIDSSSQVSEG